MFDAFVYTLLMGMGAALLLSGGERAHLNSKQGGRSSEFLEEINFGCSSIAREGANLESGDNNNNKNRAESGKG